MISPPLGNPALKNLTKVEQIKIKVYANSRKFGPMKLSLNYLLR